MRDGPLRVCGGIFFAEGADAEGAAAEIHGNTREARAGEAREGGAGGNRVEGAAEVADTVDPTIVNFKGKKNAAGAKHAVDLCKHAVLQFAGAKMVQDENRDGGGKGLRGEGKLRGVTAECAARSAIVLGFQIAGGVGVVFEGSDARDDFAEL